jgi:hypothetical protein
MESRTTNMSSEDRGAIPRPCLRGRQSGVTPDGACRRPNGDARRIPRTAESHCLVFPKPQVPSTTPGARSCGSWACPLLDATRKTCYRIGPQRPSLCKGRKGGPVLAPAYCSSLLDLVYNNSLGRLASHAAHQVRPANVPRYSAL